MPDLTAAAIAELRRRYDAVLKGSASVDTADGYVTLIHPDAPKLTVDLLRVLPSLLDEVERRRREMQSLWVTHYFIKFRNGSRWIHIDVEGDAHSVKFEHATRFLSRESADKCAATIGVDLVEVVARETVP
jgi:hypothetical protein